MNTSIRERIALVDDDQRVREGYEQTVAYADMTPVPIKGPSLGNLDTFLNRLTGVDAGLSDYQLSPSGYAHFNGAQLVAAWYQRGFPAVLCTRYESAEIDNIRPYMPYIPAIVSSKALNPDSFLESLRVAKDEISGRYREERKPWRAQVHVLEFDELVKGAVLVEVPSWDGGDVVRIIAEHLPPDIRHMLLPGRRLFARVNLGSVGSNTLYFNDWELGKTRQL